MSDAVKLTTGYIELTVKKAGDAMKEITAEITGVQTTAEKVGQAAGQAINKGVTQGAKDAGKAVHDEITSAAQKASKDAGQIKVEPTVTPKVESGGIRDAIRDIGRVIRDGMAAGAAEGGQTLDDVLSEMAADAGKHVADQLNESIKSKGILGGLVDAGAQIGIDLASRVGDGLTAGLRAAAASVGSSMLDELQRQASDGADRVTGVLSEKLGNSAIFQKIVAGADTLNQKLTQVSEQGVMSLIDTSNTAGAKWSSRFTSMGAVAAATFTGVVGSAQSSLGSLDGLVGKAKDLLGGEDTWAAPGLDAFSDGLRSAMELLTGLSPVVTAIATSTELFSAAAKAASIVQWAWNAALTANPIGLIVAGIAAVVAALVLFFTKTETGKKVWAVLVQAGKAAWDGIKAAIGAAWDFMKPIWDGLVSSIKTVGTAVIAMWHNFFQPAWDGIKNGIAAAWDFIKDIFGKIKGGFNAVGDFIKGVANGIGSAVRSAFNGLVEIIKAPIHLLGRFLQSLPDLPVPGLDGLKSIGGTLAALKDGGVAAGVTGSGAIYGPGTGTSDSILGVDSDGAPTALVSRGEGVVRERAMANGADAVVAALNSGADPGEMLRGMFPGLPRYEQGTPADPIMQRWLAAMQRGFNPSAPLAPGSAAGGESGLQTNTIRARRLISQLFPEIGEIGGYRQPDGYNEHSSGQALDVMIPGWNTPEGKALGDQVNQLLMQNAGALGLDYDIWQHGQSNPDGSFQRYPDRGDANQNHLTHVHSHSIASGMPDKDQQYFLPKELQDKLAALQGQAGGGQGGAPVVPIGVQGGKADLAATGGSGSKEERTEGYIPAGAGGGGQAGSSFASGLLNMGADAINGLIDQAASAAATAASAAATAGSMGAGGQAAGPAAAFAIGLGANAAKRGVSYGFQMLGIGVDSLAEQLSPFGVPRYFQTDPTQFIPQLPGQQAAVTTGEKAEEHKGTGEAPGPVQPGQLPGAQPVGPPAAKAEPQGVPSAPVPVGGPPSPAASPNVPPPTAAVPVPQQPNLVDFAVPKPGQQQPQTKNWPDFLRSAAGVYDRGGWLAPGGVAINKSKRPEPLPVFNHDQWGTLNALANREVPRPDPSASGARNDYGIRIDQVTVKDVAELESQLSSKQRLQMMRHAGRP